MYIIDGTIVYQLYPIQFSLISCQPSPVGLPSCATQEWQFQRAHLRLQMACSTKVESPLNIQKDVETHHSHIYVSLPYGIAKK
jgi:hypothetical protein